MSEGDPLPLNSDPSGVLPRSTRSTRSLGHFTPLRYPGGKAKLAPFLKRILSANHLLDAEYVEPYAGGAGVALELLMNEYVSHIHINDISRPIYSFWRSVLEHTDELCRLIQDTPRTVDAWDEQKSVLKNQAAQDTVSVGFAAFYLNRTNRSGILNAGIIGGREQTGQWKIDARFNAPELIQRIQAIASRRRDISLTQKDAMSFLRLGVASWPAKTIVYLDPPYYVKGRDLYTDFYKHEDHAEIADFVRRRMKNRRWIVSYDNAPEIHQMYSGERQITYDIGYSARSATKGREVMFFSESLQIPPLVGAVELVESVDSRRA